MNISENLTRIKQGKDDIITALQNKGSDIQNDTLINEISNYVDKLEIGGGGDIPSVPTELTPKYEGASVFRINVPTDNYEFAINLCNDATKATYDVDWGDGILESGLTTDEQHHTYNKKGIYDVNIYNISKDITLGGKTNIGIYSSVNVYYLFNNTNNDYWLGNNYSYQKDNITVINVLIGDKITSFGNYAFRICSSLQSIVIPEGVTNIGDSAFSGCSSLQSIVIPEGVKSINTYAFQGCSSLQSVVIPEGVKSINTYAFQGCSSLQSVVIPEGITSIGSYAFQGCSSLQSVVIPEGVTKIDTHAFNGCSSLQSIVIPDSVTSIGNYAFQGCSSLQSVVIPEGVTSFGDYTFQGCSSLQSVVISEGVTKIGYNAFSGCSSLQNIVISEGVKSIGGNIFNECYSLIYIDLPSTLTSIGSSNFNGSYSASNSLHYIISRAKTAPTIQSSTFQYSASNGILYIPKDADITTYQSSYWETYLLDKGWTIEYIEDMPEKVPSTLEFTTVNDMLIKVSNLGKGQLISEEKIDNKYIYNFDDIIYLGQNTLPKSLFTTMKFIGGVELGINCCYGWTTLQNIVIPEGVTNIGDSAFYNCSSLQSIVIPESVTNIGTTAFSGCSSLTSINIPEGVTRIEMSTFSSCSTLSNIKFPNTLTFIGMSAFNGCSLLQSITCKALTAPTIANSTFNNISTQVPSGVQKVLRVPEGAEGYETWLQYLKDFTLEYVPLSEL